MKKLKFVSALAALSMFASLFVGCGGMGPGAGGGNNEKQITQPDSEGLSPSGWLMLLIL